MARRRTFLEPQTEKERVCCLLVLNLVSSTLLLRRFALGVIGIVLSINNTSLLTTWDDDRQDRLHWQGAPPCAWSRRNEAGMLQMLASHNCTEHWNEAGMRKHPPDSGRTTYLKYSHSLSTLSDTPSLSPSSSSSSSPSSSLSLSPSLTHTLPPRLLSPLRLPPESPNVTRVFLYLDGWRVCVNFHLFFIYLVAGTCTPFFLPRLSLNKPSSLSSTATTYSSSSSSTTTTTAAFSIRCLRTSSSSSSSSSYIRMTPTLATASWSISVWEMIC